MKNLTRTRDSLDSIKKYRVNIKQATDFDLFFKKFTNLLMTDGKKTKASKILFTMLLALKKKLEQNPYKNEKKALDLEGITNGVVKLTPKLGISHGVNYTLLRVISKALENVTPNLEIRKVRVSGSTYSVPAVLSKKKQETLALKWIINSAKKKQKTSKNDFSMSLADEFLDASKKLGLARQKRDELHRLAQTNRAYVRYRWW